MKENFVRKWLVAAVLVGLQGLSAPAQEGQASTPSLAGSGTPQATSSAPTNPATTKTGQKDPTEAAAQSSTQNSVGADGVLKMLHAGVSKDVIKTYIETAQVATRLSAADLVTLKEHGVPDDLTVALMKRGAELAAQANQADATNAAPAKVTGTISLNELSALLRSRQFNGGSLDPEGYDYFQYYYLHPRTLADANQRLFSSCPSFPAFPPYSFGYYSPRAFRPRPFAP